MICNSAIIPNPSLDFEKNLAKSEEMESIFENRIANVLSVHANRKRKKLIPDSALSRDFAEENREKKHSDLLLTKPTDPDSKATSICSNDGFGFKCLINI